MDEDIFIGNKGMTGNIELFLTTLPYFFDTESRQVHVLMNL